VNPSIGPIEEAYFKLRFELLNLARERGLSNVKQFRRFRDVSNLAGFRERAQLAQVNVMFHIYGITKNNALDK